MPNTKKPDANASGLLNFEETRRANLASFGKTTYEQRVEWLGDMLELMQLARQAGPPRSEPPDHHP